METPAAPPPTQKRQAAADVSRSEDQGGEEDDGSGLAGIIWSCSRWWSVIYSHSFALLLQLKVLGVTILKQHRNISNIGIRATRLISPAHTCGFVRLNGCTVTEVEI